MRYKKIALIALPFFLFFLFMIPKLFQSSFMKPFITEKIEQKTGLDFSVEKMKFSWFGPQIFQDVALSNQEITAKAEKLLIKAPFWRFSGAFSLENGSISYQRQEKVQDIQGELEKNSFELTGKSLEGYIHLKGHIYSKLHFQIQIDVKKFPLKIINQTVESILGPTLDLSGNVGFDQTSGALDLHVLSQNLSTHIQADLKKDGATLKEPLLAKIRLTEKISSLLLSEINPLFLTGIRAKNPIVLRIEKEGFSFPFPYFLKKLKVQKATLNLGQVECRQGESLSAIASLLKIKELQKEDIMQVWFAPLEFQIENGFLHAKRLDALLDHSIHICSWGKINLIKQKLDLFLGLPAKTLKKVFQITNLDPDYVLPIQVKGSPLHPEVVKGPAAAKIAALLASNQIPRKGIFQGFSNLFKGQKNENVPEAKRPFPWEDKTGS